MKTDYRNKKIVVVGAGKSGQALARYLVARGASVALSDNREEEQINGLEDLDGLALRRDFGGHNLELFEHADLIVVSPGVPSDIEALKRARDCHIPVLGEIEIASRDLDAALIAITGTNGKSTTTTLIGRVFEAWQQQVFVGGNLGTPLIDACSQKLDAAVVELSSFQLETVTTFHPHIGLLLNLSADHLDRYADLEGYYQTKLNLFANMDASDFAVLNADDADVCRLGQGVNATQVWFSARGRVVKGLVRLGERLVWNWNGEDESFPLADLQISGEHNIENAMAALTTVLVYGCPATLAWEAICSFSGLRHRMQLVRRVNDSAWYNDSKGTNVGSVVKSLSGLGAPVVLIAGGKDKGGDYSPLRGLLENKVSTLVLIGEAAPRMAAELAGACEILFAADLADAVAQASLVAGPGSTVVLSPACSSYDMFPNYEVRGDCFEQLVLQLPERKDRP